MSRAAWTDRGPGWRRAPRPPRRGRPTIHDLHVATSVAARVRHRRRAVHVVTAGPVDPSGPRRARAPPRALCAVESVSIRCVMGTRSLQHRPLRIPSSRHATPHTRGRRTTPARAAHPPLTSRALVRRVEANQLVADDFIQVPLQFPRTHLSTVARRTLDEVPRKRARRAVASSCAAAEEPRAALREQRHLLALGAPFVGYRRCGDFPFKECPVPIYRDGPRIRCDPMIARLGTPR